MGNSFDQFLSDNRISVEDWAAANVDWPLLESIRDDFLSKNSEFRSSAEYFANIIQQIPLVHSVRWRVKDSSHLLEKIVRKRASGSEKYQSIDLSNYHEVVTDLVGIRAIHLFKEDLFPIDEDIRGKWNILESPVVYVREGDSQNSDALKLFEIKKHSFGYRSAHYIIESSPTKRKIIAELQVRTIFEEGWSEIDHSLRYPNFSDNDELNSILTIFNRLAGSADEIGGFAKKLSHSLVLFEQKANDLRHDAEIARQERDLSVENMDKLLGELERLKTQDKQSSDLIHQLQAQLKTIKVGNPGAVSWAAQPSKGSGESGAGAAFVGFLAGLALASKG